MISLCLETRLEELQRLHTAVEKLGRKEQWPLDLLYQVRLVLEEVILNIINYGHDGGVHKIDVDVIPESDSLSINIVDDGRAFDPLNEVGPADVESGLEDRPVGGLGIHLVQSLMDEVHYRREQDKNHLTLIKRREG